MLTQDGRGIRNIYVVINGGALTTPRVALTSSFGYFAFDDIEVGQTYVISISSKRYGFAQPTQAISVIDNVNDLVFQASWEN